MGYDLKYLHERYNATSTEDETGLIETYESWLERQLLSRIKLMSAIEPNPLPSRSEYIAEQNKHIEKFKASNTYLCGWNDCEHWTRKQIERNNQH